MLGFIIGKTSNFHLSRHFNGRSVYWPKEGNRKRETIRAFVWDEQDVDRVWPAPATTGLSCCAATIDHKSIMSIFCCLDPADLRRSHWNK